MIFAAPKRRRSVEYLDEPDVDPEVRVRSLRDVERSNALFGGRRAALLALAQLLGDPAGATANDRELTMLDVGTGLADIPEHALKRLALRHRALRAIGLDVSQTLLLTARSANRIATAVCGSALTLPFADGSVDIAMCSQLLHHFEDADAVRVLSELDRVARRYVIVSDLRRSWIAAAGFWLASFVLRFHPVTRHDGVVSVLRGFTGRELRGMVLSATGGNVQPAIQHRLGFRVTASWSPLQHR